MTLRFTERAHGENTLARVGLALIGLHILDDSYLQPEPGTSAREHIVSGVVPLVMLIIAAAFYPRVRAGTRAVVALFFGFFGIAAGAAEAGYNAFNGGFSGDDYTGFSRCSRALSCCLLVCGRSGRRDASESVRVDATCVDL